jgi:hypothetical protein
MSRRDPEDLAGGFLNTAWSCGGRADCGDDDGRPQGCLSDVVHWRYGQRGEGSGDGERCPATQGNRLVQPRALCARFGNPVIQILN